MVAFTALDLTEKIMSFAFQVRKQRKVALALWSTKILKRLRTRKTCSTAIRG